MKLCGNALMPEQHASFDQIMKQWKPIALRNLNKRPYVEQNKTLPLNYSLSFMFYLTRYRIPVTSIITKIHNETT